MTYRVFLPSDGLVKTARSTAQALAIIASLAAILTALAGTLYILTWLCSVLALFIHSFSGVCHEAYRAIGSSSMSLFFSYVILVLIVIKLACLLFPSLPSFFRGNGARV